jgi:hypothetical protein
MNHMETKNPVARTAYAYSGSPWALWLQAITSTWVAAFLLTRHVFGLSILGAVSAIFTIFYYACLVHYYRYRAEFSANPAKPLYSSWKQVVWIVGITLALIAAFVLLELFVWRS